MNALSFDLRALVQQGVLTVPQAAGMMVPNQQPPPPNTAAAANGHGETTLGRRRRRSQRIAPSHHHHPSPSKSPAPSSSPSSSSSSGTGSGSGMAADHPDEPPTQARRRGQGEAQQRVPPQALGPACALVFSAVNDPAVLCDLMDREGVTDSAGVPTVWLATFQYCDAEGKDLPKLKSATIGGSAAPRCSSSRRSSGRNARACTTPCSSVS